MSSGPLGRWDRSNVRRALIVEKGSERPQWLRSVETVWKVNDSISRIFASARYSDPSNRRRNRVEKRALPAALVET